MVELKQRRLLIDGKPVLVFAGEVHYYRLQRDEWLDRIRKAKDLGCNAIASYIPWLIHEPKPGEFDLSGSTKPENDLGAFIDICEAEGLWFIARPGPFIMAEMKNEGIPYWVYKNHPETIPVTWDGEKARSKTLDYLAPAFLQAAQHWYSQVMPLLAQRLQTKGGPVIAVQLDNEIGMLSWVNNQPDLTDFMLDDWRRWLSQKYENTILKGRYPSLDSAAIRKPAKEIQAALRVDLGDYYQERIARYVHHLRTFAERYGVKDIPFLVNIHGSGGGRGQSFPIGIQQLMLSYTQSEGYLSGSDHYLGELTRQNAPDLYVINAFMASVHRPEQPLSSLEFEVGTGDYGETGAVRQSGASADLKVRLSLAQGNRLLNYYLLAGGKNPPLAEAKGDGNARAAFTGGRHGFAAPINPEGKLDPTYHALKDTTREMLKWREVLADSDEEHDPVALGFVPDYYKTDFRRPGPLDEIVGNLEYVRGPLEILSRALLFLGYRFPAIHLDGREIDPAKTKLVALASSRYLERKAQESLARYVEAGGSLFLHGELPTLDREGKPCPVLAEALGVRSLGWFEGSGERHPSVQGIDWAADQPEVRLWRGEAFQPNSDRVRPFMNIVERGEVAGFESSHGRGKATVLAGNYPCHLPLFRRILERLGAKPGLEIIDKDPITDGLGGIMATTTRSSKGVRLLHVLNLDHYERKLEFKESGKSLAKIVMKPRSGEIVKI